ncbi:MAG: 6-phosphogluconate dehydrogenase [Saprospiraceae bacterium]|nr:6-phosphogluconate dehydrogenase [Saprospiraceae bacterium]
MLLISGFVMAIGYYFYRTYTFSEGTRTGILYKISKKGNIFKTFEGQLQSAGTAIMNKESTFEFSVENEDIYKSMQSMEGKNVRLYYKQLNDAFFWQGDTDYMVFKVEEIK